MARRANTTDALELRLYVAGQAPNSLLASANARAVCEEHFAGQYHLEIVDMLVHPKRALADAVIVTPTLIKLAPGPMQRVIGSLNDTRGLLAVLVGS